MERRFTTNNDFVGMAAKVTIVYFINSLNVGGAEVGMCRLLCGLEEQNYDVTLVALDGRSSGVSDQIPSWVNVIRLQPSPKKVPQMCWVILRSILNADIIVGSLFHSATVARLAGLVNQSATVATWHHANLFESNVRRFGFKLTAPLADVILADSEPVAEMLTSNLGLDNDLVHTVPIAGINLDDYEHKRHRNTSVIKVGTIGRLTKQKNHNMILNIAEKVDNSAFQFELAGDGELYSELQEAIHDRNLTNVTLHGFIDNVPSFLGEIDIYLQPSRWEGLCITVLEAMATGLPIVGSDIGGIGRNVEDGVSGYLCKPDDINGFVSGIRTLSRDANQRQEFGDRGRNIVEERFTQNVLVREFENAIRTQ